MTKSILQLARRHEAAVSLLTIVETIVLLIKTVLHVACKCLAPLTPSLFRVTKKEFLLVMWSHYY